MTEILYQEGAYKITRQAGLPAEALEFLDAIAWGNEGAVYEHKDTAKHIHQLHRPTLIAIYENEQILGTAVFCQTDIGIQNNRHNCYYIRYFAASPSIRGKGIMKRFSIKVMELIREQETQPSLYYAVFEKGNRASYKVVKSAGYSDVGVIKTMGFSRFFPKQQADIVFMNSPAEQAQMLDLLGEQYSEHALVQFNALFKGGQFAALRQGDQIVAACQYHRVHWVVNRMSGFTGKIIIQVLPRLPLLKRIFNPRRFDFLAFEGIYVLPGYESELFRLFEGLLAREGLYSSMFWMGEGCPVRARLLRHGRLGLIHRFIKDSDIYVLASQHQLPEEVFKQLKAQPLYASAFDFI